MVVKAEKGVFLAGFDVDEGEKALINNLIKNYVDKIKQRISFKEIRLRLKKSKMEKTFLHEVKGTLVTDGKEFKAEETGYNLLATISEVFETLMKEAEHKKRTKRQEAGLR